MTPSLILTYMKKQLFAFLIYFIYFASQFSAKCIHHIWLQLFNKQLIKVPPIIEEKTKWLAVKKKSAHEYTHSHTSVHSYETTPHWVVAVVRSDVASLRQLVNFQLFWRLVPNQMSICPIMHQLHTGFILVVKVKNQKSARFEMCFIRLWRCEEC